ncbi:MAG: cobyrinic acid a,c-diamide synthase [Pirellulaceae bacterium]|nr:MAG: cobyrinic acid a,c-diamide synthase [Pirellulaceae bacterium]
MIIPRLALGTVQPSAQTTWLTRALMAVAERAGFRVQGFASRSVFTPDCGAQLITGRQTRHLDSWLMDESFCRALFYDNMRSADLALVEGVYRQGQTPMDQGPSLEQLCQWLELPQLVVLDVRNLSWCNLPRPEIGVDGVFLDGVSSVAEYERLAVDVEYLWGAPVLGGLIGTARLDEQHGLYGEPQARRQRLAQLADNLERHLRWDELNAIAARPLLRQVERLPWRRVRPGRPLQVALAFDNAIQCYFPDTLDALEVLGAELRTFSPLADAELPNGTDLVYIGCGKIDQYAEQLSANHCLRAALWRFAKRGGRIYAECGGAAYLCREIVLADRSFSMLGVVPATARQNASGLKPQPVEFRWKARTWLGNVGQTVRGYLNPNWTIIPDADVLNLADSSDSPNYLVGWRNVVLSRVHINFATIPSLLQRWVLPANTG